MIGNILSRIRMLTRKYDKQYIKTELRYKVKVYELVEHMDHSIGDMMRNIVCSV